MLLMMVHNGPSTIIGLDENLHTCHNNPYMENAKHTLVAMQRHNNATRTEYHRFTTTAAAAHVSLRIYLRVHRVERHYAIANSEVLHRNILECHVQPVTREVMHCMTECFAESCYQLLAHILVD